MTPLQDLTILKDILDRSLILPESINDFRKWKQVWTSLWPRRDLTIDRALEGGLAADRPAWAFAAGYQAAIQALSSSFGVSPETGTGAVCITEKDGAHPSAMRSCLEPISGKSGYWKLSGEKTFVSGAQEADILWVAASIGKAADGRNTLRMVTVPSGHPGVTIVSMPPLGLIPEMPHAKAVFRSVVLPDNAVLPGDGYLVAVKPFRTLEDLHVTAAFLAFLFGIGRRFNWAEGILERLMLLMAAARSLAPAPPLAVHTHLALSGLLSQVHQLVTEIEPLWETVDADIRTGWQRDKKILFIAEAVRRKRRESAWQRILSHGAKGAP